MTSKTTSTPLNCFILTFDWNITELVQTLSILGEKLIWLLSCLLHLRQSFSWGKTVNGISQLVSRAKYRMILHEIRLYLFHINNVCWTMYIVVLSIIEYLLIIHLKKNIYGFLINIRQLWDSNIIHSSEISKWRHDSNMVMKSLSYNVIDNYITIKTLLHFCQYTISFFKSKSMSILSCYFCTNVYLLMLSVLWI